MPFQLHTSLTSRLWLAINWTVMRWRPPKVPSPNSGGRVLFFLVECLCFANVLSLDEFLKHWKLTNCRPKLFRPLIFSQSVKSQEASVKAYSASRLVKCLHSELETWPITGITRLYKELYWDCLIYQCMP